MSGLGTDAALHALTPDVAAGLRAGAGVVVTGRVTDASLVVGPAAAHFGWSAADLDALAGAVVAGHVLECGAQATGGNYAFFTELDASRPGYPIAEVFADGSSVITKHDGTGGAVTVDTVTAQLLYEIAGARHLGPDVSARFDTITLTAEGPDRVRISGVRGEPPPPTTKVCLNTLGGFRNATTFVLCGLDVGAKAALVRAQLEAAVGAERSDLVFMQQVHGGAVAVVDADDRGRGLDVHDDGVPAVDALVGTAAGVAPVVQVADCVPVLMADPGHAVAAVHGGRGGLVADLILTGGAGWAGCWPSAPSSRRRPPIRHGSPPATRGRPRRGSCGPWSSAASSRG